MGNQEAAFRWWTLKNKYMGLAGSGSSPRQPLRLLHRIGGRKARQRHYGLAWPGLSTTGGLGRCRAWR